jgi:hypothetical protein
MSTRSKRNDRRTREAEYLRPDFRLLLLAHDLTQCAVKMSAAGVRECITFVEQQGRTAPDALARRSKGVALGCLDLASDIVSFVRGSLTPDQTHLFEQLVKRL